MNAINGYCVAAAAIAFVVGLAHSVLDERLIFNRLRQSGRNPTHGGNSLGERHIRIIWASWHLVTIFGWGLGAVLWQLSLPSAAGIGTTGIGPAIAIAVATAAGAALVCIATRGRHPGWIGLLAIATCVLLGQPH